MAMSPIKETQIKISSITPSGLQSIAATPPPEHDNSEVKLAKGGTVALHVESQRSSLNQSREEEELYPKY